MSRGKVLGMCQGAWETKLLASAVELDIFSRIAKGAKTPDQISEECGVDARLLGMMVNACEAMGLVSRKADKLYLSPEAKRLLVRESPDYMGGFIAMAGGEYYDAWRGFRETVITGRPVRNDRMLMMSNPGYAGAHLRAMEALTAGAARTLSTKAGLRAKSLLEIGGGTGNYSFALARSVRGMKAVIFDSPFACEQAKKRIEKGGLKGVSVRPGDAEKGELPKGHDAMMLSHVLQWMPPERCEAMLRRVCDALPKGGTVLVNEFLLEKGGTSPAFSSLLAFNAFMLSDGGGLHHRESIEEWLTNAGFSGVKAIKASPIIVTLKAAK